jgi:hypothetical protein
VGCFRFEGWVWMEAGEISGDLSVVFLFSDFPCLQIIGLGVLGFGG